jgi:cytochrome c oxidase subunit 3
MTTTEAAAPDDTILYHHFDDLDQQHLSSVLGMWVFLATEVLFFGGLLAAYVIYRALYRGAFIAAGEHLNVILGGINTAVLLTSSLTMALAVRAAQFRRHDAVVLFLSLTTILGATFLGIKAVEWYRDYQEHLMPGVDFDWAKAQAGRHEPSPRPDGRGTEGTSEVHEAGPGAGKSTAPSASVRRAESEMPLPLLPPPGGTLGEEPTTTEAGRAQLFFCLYFFLTGLHGLHMIIGIGLLAVFIALVRRRWFSGGGATQIEMLGLYWHFVDIVWVYLYPILYLIDIKS